MSAVTGEGYGRKMYAFRIVFLDTEWPYLFTLNNFPGRNAIVRVAVWLNTNNEAVLVIVTTVYAFLTLLLWLATKQQTEITRLTFEASLRPYVSVKAEEPGPDFMPLGQSSGRLSFNIAFENHGAGPAATDQGTRAAVPRRGRAYACVAGTLRGPGGSGISTRVSYSVGPAA